jgi:hypothetical protein
MRGLPALMLRTVTEAAADIRERNRIATVRRRSAGGAATLATPVPVVDGVRARRVRVAGEAAVVVVDGAAEVAVVDLAAVAGGSETTLTPGTQELHPSEDQNVFFSQ